MKRALIEFNRKFNSSFYAMTNVGNSHKILADVITVTLIVKETTCPWTEDIVTQYHKSKCPFRTVSNFKFEIHHHT